MRMPIAGLGLHVLIAIYFASHVLRTGQDRYWLMILFAFPLLGSLVYALVIWLPDARNSRQGHQVVRGVRNLLDPTRELREAQDALDLAATPHNRLRLADALLGDSRASEAVVQYQAVLSGMYADDPHVRIKLARALLEAGKPNDARELLDRLIREQPKLKSPDGHLIYARAVAALGDRVKTHEEFDSLVSYFAGMEARAYYAEILLAWGESARCRQLIDDSKKIAKRMPGAARDINREWLTRLKKVESALAAPASV
jgi:hypothetical protein